MPVALISIERILALLRETPGRLAASTDGLTPAQLRLKPNPDEWSANEILAHLRSCADMWGQAIATILAEDHPTIRAINPVRWIRSTDYPDQEFASSLRAFTTQRAALLDLLEPLPREAWARAATVTGAGKPLQLTTQHYGDRLATHERAHVKSVARLVNTVRG